MADQPANPPQDETQDAVADANALRVGDEGSSQATPGKPLETGGSGKVTVRTRWPYDSFEHGIKDVPVITADGVEVDRSKAKTLIEKAQASGIELEEIEG